MLQFIDPGDMALLRQAVSFMLGTAAVALGSMNSLAVWIAVKNLPRPTTAQTEKPNLDATPFDASGRFTVHLPADAPDDPAELGWRKRLLTKTFARRVGIMLVFYAVLGAILYLIFWRSSQLVVDVFWTVLGSAVAVLFIAAAMDFAFPRVVGVFRLYDTKAKTFGIQFKELNEKSTSPIGSKSRFAIAGVMTAAIVIAAWHGFDVPTAIVPACIVIGMISMFHTKTLRIKWIIFIPIIYVFAVIVITAIVGFIVVLSQDKDKPSDEPSQGPTQPNRCIKMLLTVWNEAIPLAAPGVLIAATLRYDSSKSEAISKLTFKPANESDGQTKARLNIINFKIPPFSRPLYISGLASLVIAMNVALAFFLLPATRGFVVAQQGSALNLFLTFPTVAVGTALAAWCRGELRDWWNYTEVWVPKVSEIRQESETEMGLLEEQEEQTLADAK